MSVEYVPEGVLPPELLLLVVAPPDLREQATIERAIAGGAHPVIAKVGVLLPAGKLAGIRARHWRAPPERKGQP